MCMSIYMYKYYITTYTMCITHIYMYNAYEYNIMKYNIEFMCNLYIYK